ncbi:MAG: hypothetical protein CNLJKLNK_00328 [Holosporales bacterium]
MTQLYDYYKSKQISYTDWKAGILYGKLRNLFERSIEKRNSLHKSSLTRLFETKGIVHDLYQSKAIEQLWNGMHHLAKFDSFPLFNILDALIAPTANAACVRKEHAKHALKKIRKIFKAIDLPNFLEQI